MALKVSGAQVSTHKTVQPTIDKCYQTLGCPKIILYFRSSDSYAGKKLCRCNTVLRQCDNDRSRASALCGFGAN